MMYFLLIQNTATIIGLWGSHSRVAAPHLDKSPTFSLPVPASCCTYTVPSPADHPTLCFSSPLPYRNGERIFKCLTDALQSFSRPLAH
jgi:hypothetical protein